jgi:hypothetical protein
MAGVASTEDKIDLNQQAGLACWDGVTDYRITRFFGGSNGRSLKGPDGEQIEKF